MFTSNPFADLTVFLPPRVMQAYIVLMIFAVPIGTIFDAYHKGSAKFFARRRKKAAAAAQRRLSGMETASLAASTIAEAAVSGEFCKWKRRTSHLLMLYGFLPLQGLQRLEKLMDEYVGGYTTFYVTNEPLLNRGLELLGMLKEDFEHIGAEDLHQLQRAWELHHRILTAESVARHTLFRQETRWPGYYYRADHPKLNDADWHVFTASQYDAKTGDWRMSKLPVHNIIA